MKRMALFFLAVMVALGVGHPALAHIVSTDHEMTGVLHIEPKDIPVVGRQASFGYELQDSTNRFHLGQCDCTLHVYQNDKEIFFQKLAKTQPANTIVTPGVDFIFYQAGTYKAKLVGEPVTLNVFRPFVLDQKFLVVSNTTAGTLSAWWYTVYHFLAHYAYVGVFLVMFIYLFARGKLTFQQNKKSVQTNFN